MYIFTSGVCKKPSLDLAEDLVGGNGNFYWLLDGATPPADSGNHELTYRFVQTLNQGLTVFSLRAENPEDLLFNAINYVKNDFEQRGIVNSYLPCSTVVIVQMLETKIRYLVLGDSYLCICAGNYTLIETDDRLKTIAVEERGIVRKMRESNIPENSKEYQDARKNLILAEAKSRNKTGGYWVAELNPDAAKEGKMGEVSFDDNEKLLVLAATDGLERLISLFEVYPSLKEVGQAIQKKGVVATFNQLRELENDPSKFKKPISSKHDDASFFLLSNCEI